MKKTILPVIALLFLNQCLNTAKVESVDEQVVLSIPEVIIQQDREWIQTSADTMMHKVPRTVTEAVCDRSQGTSQDFYSEGDYWWPDPENPEGPYIRRDGMTNPENFTIHRLAMREMSITVGTLAAAFKITGDEIYAMNAIPHLHTWFLDPKKRMNPNMAYAQAIKGRVPGRGVGLIDGIHLVEVVKAIELFHKRGVITEDEFKEYQDWFADFLDWILTHEYGIDERERKNNHGTAWVFQVAAFAGITENYEVLDYCRKRYKTVLLPNQMDVDGSYHMELSRTKPYGYSLFNMDLMAAVCHILTSDTEDIWKFTLEDGRGMVMGMEFITPYIADKSKWSYPPDVMYWDEWPARHPALLFAGYALEDVGYIELWKQFSPLPQTQEGLRNFPIRFPILWFD